MTGHVLIVEDDQDLAELLREVLQLHGYDAATAGNGQEALDSIGARMPSLIVLDMMMPIMNGWQFAQEFAARHGRVVPIIVITAAENARARAAEIGADDVLGKPFDVQSLIEAVQRLTVHWQDAARGESRTRDSAPHPARRR